MFVSVFRLSVLVVAMEMIAVTAVVEAIVRGRASNQTKVFSSWRKIPAGQMSANDTSTIESRMNSARLSGTRQRERMRDDVCIATQ